MQDALLDVVRFWLDRGVDGFRIDAINFAMHDPELRDNPPAPPSNKVRTRPFDFQLKIHNQSHPDIPLFLERIRALTDEYGGSFTVAEVGGDDAVREMKLFTAGDRRLNSAYGFDFLYADRLTPALVAAAIAQWPEGGAGWPSWAFENHDAPRAVSRWADEANRAAFGRMKMLLLACLRGNIFLYYGEELGLTQVAIPFDRLQDPEAIANWPLTLSRDGARTPMPWQAEAPALGFSSAAPWLPVGPDHAALAVDRQNRDDDSPLAWTRRVLAVRHAYAALRDGALRAVAHDDAILSFERIGDGERLLCVFNLSPEPRAWPLGDWREVVIATHAPDGDLIPPFGAMVLARDTNSRD